MTLSVACKLSAISDSADSRGVYTIAGGCSFRVTFDSNTHISVLRTSVNYPQTPCILFKSNLARYNITYTRARVMHPGESG